MPGGIGLQESAETRIINDNAAILVLTPKLGAVFLQVLDREGRQPIHVIVQSLGYATFGPRSSADMNDFSPGIVNHIDAPLFRRFQFFSRCRKSPKWRARKLSKEGSHPFLFACHIKLTS